jgi:iron complex transport system ATP-binding protein
MLVSTSASFSYRPGKPVLQEVSVALEPGAVTALIGPNGAGKSTLLRLLVGVLRPTSGSVTLDGADLAAMGHKERARRIAYIPQKTSIAFAYSVRQYVSLGRYSASMGDDAQSVSRALERMSLQPRAEDPLPELSAGQQQRAAFARALAQLDQAPAPQGTRALLADEPVAAMDPLHCQHAMQVLRDQADLGIAVGVVLHDMSLALRWCNRALLLSADGRVAAQGPTREVLAPGVLDRVFGVRFVRLEDSAAAAAAIVPAGDLTPL